ncbi:MAG: hypothetical protein QME81_16920, partial [bacterium]|nr:hypothetical protein [bacterium]
RNLQSKIGLVAARGRAKTVLSISLMTDWRFAARVDFLMPLLLKSFLWVTITLAISSSSLSWRGLVTESE